MCYGALHVASEELAQTLHCFSDTAGIRVSSRVNRNQSVTFPFLKTKGLDFAGLKLILTVEPKVDKIIQSCYSIKFSMNINDHDTFSAALLYYNLRSLSTMKSSRVEGKEAGWGV